MKIHKAYYLLLIALLLLISAVIYYMRQDSGIQITGMNGQTITAGGAVLSLDNEVLVPKELAEQVLDTKIGLAQHPPLPEGIYYRNDVAVLMYHQLTGEPEQHPGLLTAGQFEYQLSLLKQGGFKVITMEQYRRFKLEQGPIPDNAVLLTFDDGYESFYTVAFPILQKYGYTAVNFVIVSDIDHPERNQAPKLTWEQMREMKRSGMGFYNHTYDLHHYAAVDAGGVMRPAASSLLYIADENRNEINEEYYSRVTADLAMAEQRLKEELDNEDSALAFPYGSFNERLLKASEQVGIPLTFNIHEGMNSAMDASVCRINAGGRGLAGALSIERLKHLEPPMELTVDNRIIPLSKVRPEQEQDRLMIPLARLCQALEIEIVIDRPARTVKLTRVAGGPTGSPVALL